MKKLDQKNILYFIFLMVSVCVTATVVFIISKSQTPFQLKHIHTIPTVRNNTNYYYDLNKDLISEQYFISKKSDGVTSIIFKSYDNTIFDQFNIYEDLIRTGLSFSDYSGDGFDDVILFATKEDSLFLYIMDVIQKKYILRRHFLFHITFPHSYARINSAQFVRFSNSVRKQLLFVYNNGLHPKPRGLYLFDIEAKKIIKKFENPSSMEGLKLIDMDRNGIDEIVLTSYAHGNTKDKSIVYHDHTCWIFLLNQELELISKPISIGEYPSSIYIHSISIYGDGRLLTLHTNCGVQNAPNLLSLYILPKYLKSTIFNKKALALYVKTYICYHLGVIFRSNFI